MKCPAFVGIETAFVEKDTIFDCEIRHIQPSGFSRDSGATGPVDLARFGVTLTHDIVYYLVELKVLFGLRGYRQET